MSTPGFGGAVRVYLKDCPVVPIEAPWLVPALGVIFGGDGTTCM